MFVKYDNWDQDYAVDTGRDIQCPNCKSHNVEVSSRIERKGAWEKLDCLDCGCHSERRYLYP